MKKILVLFVALVLAISNVGIAALADEVQPYASDLINSYAISISSDSDGVISAIARVAANTVVDRLGFPVIRIEKKVGSAWTSVKSTSGKYKDNASQYSYELTYQGTTGTQYRAYAEFYALDGSSSDSRSRTSSTITGK